MKSRSFLFIVLLFITLIVMDSCRKVHVYEGKSVIISRTFDMSLNDSVLILGRVYSAVDDKTPEAGAKIWIEGMAGDTHSDGEGFYSIKVPGGVGTIKCKGRYSNDDEIEEIKNITLLPNEKIELNFYIGMTIE